MISPRCVGVKIVVVLHKFAVSRNLFFQRILYPCLTSTPSVLARTTPLVLTVKSQRGKWSRIVEVTGDRPETFRLGPHHSILITRWSVYSRMVQQHWTWDRQDKSHLSHHDANMMIISSDSSKSPPSP